MRAKLFASHQFSLFTILVFPTFLHRFLRLLHPSGKKRGSIMAGRESYVLGKGIKKAKKKLKKMKAATAKMTDELTQRRTLTENLYQAIVQSRESVHQLKLAAERSNAQSLELISFWLAQNNDD